MGDGERRRRTKHGRQAAASTSSKSVAGRSTTRKWPTNESIIEEISKEKQMLADACAAIDDTKSSIMAVEQEIINADYGNDKKAVKWKRRYFAQVRVNEQLEKERNRLKESVENERAKIIDGWSHYPYLYELETEMSEAEWLRLNRQLEMVKANLMSELHNVQWRLDEESKAFHQLNDASALHRLEIEAARSSTVKFFNPTTSNRASGAVGPAIGNQRQQELSPM